MMKQLFHSFLLACALLLPATAATASDTGLPDASLSVQDARNAPMAPMPTLMTPSARQSRALQPISRDLAASLQHSALRKPFVLKAGKQLSAALQSYVQSRGWQLRWRIDADYMIDVDIPVPALDLIDGVTWVVRVYQSQDGMQGVVPRFARGNKVVVIEMMDVREAAL